MTFDLKKILYHKETAVLFTAFFAFRALCYFFTQHFLLQNIFATLLTSTLIFLYFKKPVYAWNILLAEIFLGGSGNFFELFGLSLRTIFLITFLSLYIGEHLLSKEKRIKLSLSKNLSFLLTLLFCAIAWAFINGIFQGNSLQQVIQDTIPFMYLGLFFPAREMLKNTDTHPFLIRLVSVFIFASALFSLITFILFSSGSTVIQGPYYKWFRDILGGKLTNLGNGFWRVVTPEHLLLLPITLILSSLVQQGKNIFKNHTHKTILWSALFSCLFILTINLSRGYFLAIVAALIVLLYKHNFKKWFFTSTIICTSILIIFCSVSFIASKGQTFGLEIFGLRVKSLATPNIEESSYTRRALILPIMEKIKTQPLLGSGLGSNITFTNPVSTKIVSTNQFDWGYLEIITEFGALGALSYFFFIGYIFWLTVSLIKSSLIEYTTPLVGLLAGLTALLISNITAPALFHVFGILYLTITLGLLQKSPNLSKNI